MIRSAPEPLGGDTEEERDYTGLATLPGEWAVETPYWVSQPWGMMPRGQVPLAGLKTSGTDSGTVRNLDSACEKCTHACLLPKQGRGSRLKLPRTWASFPQPLQHAPQLELRTGSHPSCSMVQLHTRLKAATGKESAQMWGTEPAQNWQSIQMEWGQTLLVFIRAGDEEWSGALTGTGTTLPHAPAHAKHLLWTLLLYNAAPQ